jgi:hypothetical protein
MTTKKNAIAVSAVASLLLISTLTGCKIRDPQDVRSVDWYEKHESEREKTLAECRKNPDTFDQTPDCVNAQQAENKVKPGTQ